MLPNDEKLRFYLLMGGFFLVLGLVVILGFTYFRLQGLLTKTSVPAENKYLLQLAQIEDRKLKAEEATMPARPKEVPENCFWVPQSQSAANGIYMLDNEVEPQKYDFYYNGRLDDFKEANINGCDYYQLVMFKNIPFTLNIPLGLAQTGKKFTSLESNFLTLHKGKYFDIRVRYDSPNAKEFSPLKIEEWEILFLYITDPYGKPVQP